MHEEDDDCGLTTQFTELERLSMDRDSWKVLTVLWRLSGPTFSSGHYSNFLKPYWAFPAHESAPFLGSLFQSSAALMGKIFFFFLQSRQNFSCSTSCPLLFCSVSRHLYQESSSISSRTKFSDIAGVWLDPLWTSCSPVWVTCFLQLFFIRQVLQPPNNPRDLFWTLLNFSSWGATSGHSIPGVTL